MIPQVFVTDFGPQSDTGLEVIHGPSLSLPFRNIHCTLSGEWKPLSAIEEIKNEQGC